MATDIIEDVANYIGVPPIAVQEVATFYNMFDVKPVGKNKISVCTNLPVPCATANASAITSSASWASTGRKPPPTASSRWWKASAWRLRRFPVLLVNNKHMCVRMTEEKLDALVAALKAQGESA